MNPFIGIGPTLTRRRGGGGPSEILTPAPSSLTVFAFSNTRCDLTWTNSGGYAIIVERSTDQETYSAIHTTAAAATSYSDTTCTENTRYFYRVRATSDGKYSNYSNVATDVTLPTVLYDGNTFAYYDYEAASTITKNESNVVSRINDRLGSGNDLVSGSCTYDWLEGFVFNGTDQNMSTGAKTLNQPTFIYSTLKQKSWTANDRAFDGAAASMTIQQAYTTPQFKINAGKDLPAVAPYIGTLAINTWGILRLLFNGASTKCIVNENAAVTGDAGANNPGGIVLGSRNNNTIYWNGAYRKFIVRKVADASGDETAIYNYLKEKNTPVPEVTNLSVKSISGGARVTWTDSAGAGVEIWATENGGALTYITDVANGVQTYDDTRDVGDVMVYYVRAKKGVLVSLFKKFNITISQVAEMTSIQGATVDNISLQFIVTAGKNVYLNWGYGSDVLISSGTLKSNFPAGNTTYEITFSGDLDGITRLSTVASEATLHVQMSEISKFTALADLQLLCNFSGLVTDLPSTLTKLILYGYTGASKITGTDNFPPNIEDLRYNNTEVGSWVMNIANFPATLKYISCVQGAGINGDIADLPAAMTNFIHWGEPGHTDVYGDLGDLKEGLLEFHCEHTGGISSPGGGLTGSIGDCPSTLVTLFIVSYPDEGYNALTGSISDLITNCPNYTGGIIARCGNFSGSIDSLAGKSLGMFWFDNLVPWSTRQVTGDIANVPRISGNGLTLAGHNLTGDLKNLLLPNSQFGVYLVDNGGGITATDGTYDSWSNQTLIIREGLTTAEVDALLIGLAATAVSGTATLTLTGGSGSYINQGRSSASDAAVSTLQGLGKTILSNKI